MENIIKSVRELGKAIQADETFKAYIAAKWTPTTTRLSKTQSASLIS